MQAFARALQNNRTGLLMPWSSLGKRVHPLPGNLVLVLGAPGVGKSMFTLLWSLLATQDPDAERPVWARLVSLDTNPIEQAARVISWSEGVPAQQILDDPGRWASFFGEHRFSLLVQTCPIKPIQLADVMEVDEMYLGYPPDLVVIDDLSRMQLAERGYTDYNTAFLELHRVARHCENVVVALHHIHRGENSAGARPVQLSDGVYGGEYEAEIVLGLWRPLPNTLRVGVLKNRMGEADPTGRVYVDLHVDYGMTQIRDFMPMERWSQVLETMKRTFGVIEEEK